MDYEYHIYCGCIYILTSKYELMISDDLICLHIKPIGSQFWISNDPNLNLDVGEISNILENGILPNIHQTKIKGKTCGAYKVNIGKHTFPMRLERQTRHYKSNA